MRGVLFDVDGTLVDTTYVHAVTWAEAFRQNGHTVPMSAVHHRIGMGSSELLDALLGEDRDKEQDDTLKEAHLTLYKQWWGRLVPLPGAAELVREVAGRGLKVVLASSAKEEELEALRSTLGVDDVVTAATSGSDADQAKPEPDILEVALDKAELEADDVTFLGDAKWDGIASGKLGIPFVALTCGGTSEEELRAAGAIEVWRDPADLLAHLDKSSLLG